MIPPISRITMCLFSHGGTHLYMIKTGLLMQKTVQCRVTCKKTAASKNLEAAAADLFTSKELIDIALELVRTELIFHLPSAGIELPLLPVSTGQTAFDRKGLRVIL